MAKKKATKKKINSRQKGKRGELELCQVFRDHGFEARRGQQFKGSPDSPDLITSLEGLHVECKRVERGNLYDWLKQAEKDAGEDIPAVFHRRSGEEWVTVLKTEDFFQLIDRIFEKEI